MTADAKLSLTQVEFKLLLHFCDSDDMSFRDHLSPSAKNLLDRMKEYKQQHKEKFPSAELLRLTNHTMPTEELESVVFLTEKLRHEYINVRLQYYCDQTINNYDGVTPAEALNALRIEVEKLYTEVQVVKIHDDPKFFSDYRKRLEALLETDPEKQQENEVFRTVCNFGINTIDINTQGLCEGDYALIFGQTNQGKSWLAKSIATHVAIVQKKRVLILTYEEEPNVAIHTIDTLYTQVNPTNYMKHQLDYASVMRVQQKFGALGDQHGEVIIPPISRVRRETAIPDMVELIRLYKPDLLIIDQLTFTAKSLDWQDMAAHVRDVKTMAKLEKIAVLGLTQGKSNAKSIWEVGYEAVAHGEEVPRTADSIIYIGNDNDSTEAGVKLIKLIKSRRGRKDIIIRLRWDIGMSYIEELGEYTGPIPTATDRGRTKGRREEQSCNDYEVEAPVRSPFAWGR